MNDQRVVSTFLPQSDTVSPLVQVSQPYPIEAFSSSPTTSSPTSSTTVTNMSGKLDVQGSTGGGLFNGSAVERRGGPMDTDSPVQGIHPSMSSMQSPLQNQIYDPRQLMPPLQPLHSNQSGQSSSQQSFHSADSTLSDLNSNNIDNNYFYYSQHPLQQSHHPSTLSPNAFPLPSPTTATTSSSLTSALGQLQAPLPPTTALAATASASATATTSAAAEKSRSRRWSLTGRFFEKRKSITEPFHIPNSQPQQQNLQASYNCATNRNIVFGSGVGNDDGSNGGDGDSNVNTNNTDSSITIDTHNVNNNNNSNNNNMKQGSPTDSDGGSRRSSIVDIPKAILSSLRRGPLAGSNDPTGTSFNNSSSSGGAVTSVTNETNEDIIDVHQMMDPGFMARNPWLGGRPHITMAVPRAPPQDASALTNKLPLKSILKKRSTDMNAGASAGGFVAPAAIASAGPGPGPSHSSNGKNGNNTTGGAAVNATKNMEVHEPRPINGVGNRRPSALESEDIHPMATPDMDPEEIKLLTPPTDHRARLTTHSPKPAHPQHQELGTLSSTSSTLTSASVKESGEGGGATVGASVQMPVGGAGSPRKRNNDSSTSDTAMDMSKKEDLEQQQQHGSYNSSAGAAIPPDFAPGVQSNLHRDRGGERPQDIGGQDLTQDEMLTQQMFSLSSRAQDLVSQYYGLNDAGGSVQAPGATTAAAVAAGSSKAKGSRQRRINFLDMIEIIPAHRKSDYNRSSDKHATFRVLTPDLKSEIRDELNTYKMREMAVHVESMSNTAFH